MSPSVMIIVAGIAATLGSLGYSYHIGRSQGAQICEAEKLASELKVARFQIDNLTDISELQQDQIGEAQIKLEQETKLNAELSEKLASLPLKRKSDCIPDSVLDSIRKFRAKARSQHP